MLFHTRLIPTILLIVVLMACNNNHITPALNQKEKEHYAEMLTGTYTGTLFLHYPNAEGTSYCVDSVSKSTAHISNTPFCQTTFHAVPFHFLTHILRNDSAWSNTILAHPIKDITCSGSFFLFSPQEVAFQIHPAPILFRQGTHRVKVFLSNNQVLLFPRHTASHSIIENKQTMKVEKILFNEDTVYQETIHTLPIFIRFHYKEKS